MGYHFSSRLTATLNLCLIYFKITWTIAILLEHMHMKFEIYRTKIKGGCQSGRKVVTHNCKSDLPLDPAINLTLVITANCANMSNILHQIPMFSARSATALRVSQINFCASNRISTQLLSRAKNGARGKAATKIVMKPNCSTEMKIIVILTRDINQAQWDNFEVS